jgi:hypothetical protein
MNWAQHTIYTIPEKHANHYTIDVVQMIVTNDGIQWNLEIN